MVSYFDDAHCDEKQNAIGYLTQELIAMSNQNILFCKWVKL